jgi:hypothetical protein
MVAGWLHAKLQRILDAWALKRPMAHRIHGRGVLSFAAKILINMNT